LTGIIVLSAALGYLNVRFIKLPGTIGLLVASLLLTLLVIVLGRFDESIILQAKSFVTAMDFRKALMEFMLCFLLFAGSLHTDFSMLIRHKWPIIVFATVGVLLSTVLVGTIFFYLLHFIGTDIPFLHCLIFGALISPTDPVAVLGIMKKANVPKNLEIKVVGESLFNDGIGVVVFVTLLGVASLGDAEMNFSHVGHLFLEEVGGGILLGVGLGYICFRAMRSIDHYQTEVMLSLAFVMGGYWLADYFHFSGPIAMVVAGLFLGKESSKTARSHITEAYLEKFWEILDVLLNYILFVMIGLELLVIDFHRGEVVAGLIGIVVVLVARFLTLGMPVRAFSKRLNFLPHTSMLMTWAGLRGGISIALALSLPSELNRDFFLAVTYIVVVFSIVVQGLTLGKVVDWFLRKHKDDPEYQGQTKSDEEIADARH
jgi:CPA1 family monovalent cation:H+ antiporter